MILSAYQYCNILCIVVDQWLRRDPSVSSHRLAIQGEDPQTSVADSAAGFEWRRVKPPLRNPIVRMTLNVFDNFLVCANVEALLFGPKRTQIASASQTSA
jgi:hypothetical protein